jgi:hypothetical protein
MKKLWKTILDGLTFRDLAGHRQPRAYTVFGGLTLALILLAGSTALSSRWMLMREVHAAPLGVSITPQVTEGNFIEEQELQESAPGCPTDSSDWSLVPTYTSTSYNLIQPACVYQGLEHTISWALAVREGYSRAQATEELGFSEMPMRELEEVTIPSEDGRMAVPVSFIPSNPNFTEWRLTDEGKPAVTYALRGCFRTSTIAGNQVEVWNGDYPVVCLVIEDAENSHILYSLYDHYYNAEATPMRSFLLFGYLGDGEWVWLGTQQEPKQQITNPQAAASERLTFATLYDSQPWDANWLRNTYGLIMAPPPQGWQGMTSEYEKQTILDGLSVGASGG